MIINVISVNPEIEITSMVQGGAQKSKNGRVQRILSVAEQSKKFNLNIRFWPGVTTEAQSAYNINKAHKQIVADAKKRGLPCVCIAEDDFLMSADGAWEYYLENIPEEYDLYLGGIYSGQVEGDRIMNGFSGLTMYIVNSRFYDFFLSLPYTEHLDRYLGRYAFQKMYRICIPYIVYQMEGYSDNHRRETKHASYLENMKLFGR